MPEQLARQPISQIVRESVEGSLERLGVSTVALLQLHNSITPSRGDLPTSLTPGDVLDPKGILEAMCELQSEGLVGHLGITGLGDPDSLRRLIASGQFATVQVPYHLLNPTAAEPAAADWIETDHGGVINDCGTAGMGVFAIRVYAGGALLGRPPAQHTHTTKFFPMDLYERDTRRGREIGDALPEDSTLQHSAVRFSLDHPAISSAIIGFSLPEHIDQAVAALAAP
jgi:aryl-alcohol dehydrogenase-like predicted oxidoreductase